MIDRRVLAQCARFRRIFLIAAAAVWGMSFAIAAIAEFRRPAPPGQLPGLMTYENLDAAGPFHAALLSIVTPFLFALIGRLISPVLEDGSVRTWSFVTTVASMLAGAWLALLNAGAGAVLLFPLYGITVALLFRRFEASFSPRDVVLIPTGLTTYFALVDLNPAWSVARNAATAALVILVVRLAVIGVSRHRIDPPDAYVVAPFAILLQGWNVRASIRYNGWLPLLITIGTPLLLAIALRRSWHKTIRRVVAWATLPGAILFYSASLLMNVGGVREPQVDFFEHGHSLMPASEMLRGRLPYRDVIPGHGLGEDGLLDLIAMKTKGVTAGDVLEVRLMFSAANAVGLYAVAFGATGSPEIGYLAAMTTSSMLAWGATFTRSVFAFFALACAVVALRRRNRRWFVLAGAFGALQCLHSVDFGFYTTVALGVAVFLSSSHWQQRARSLLSAGIGAALVLIPFAGTLAYLGVFDDFLRVTFVEIPALGSVYTLGFPDLAATVPRPWSVPEVLAAALSTRSLPFVLWPIVMIATATIAVVGARRRTAPLLVIGSYVAIAALSYAERRHPYYAHAIPLFLMIGIVTLWRIPRPTARVFALVLIALTVIASAITPHLVLATFVRMDHSTLDSNWADMWDTPRARHALFWHEDVRRFRLLRDWMKSNLRPDETFFDFSNVPLLYFLLDRPAPVRQYEVAFYEAPEQQREVIARLRHDRTIRAAIVQFSLRNQAEAIDGIPNPARAPLVWKYLQENFRPELNADGVEVWVRK